MLMQKLWLGLITPILLISVLTGCARVQGATAPTGVFNGTSDRSNLVGSALEIDRNNSFLPQVEAAAIEPIINYVDSLNWALAGDLSKFKKSCPPRVWLPRYLTKVKEIIYYRSLNWRRLSVGNNYA